MAEIHEIGSGAVRLSISQIATEFSVARATVAKYIDQCNVAPSGARVGYPTYRLADVIGLLTAKSATDASIDPAKLRPTDRNAWYQSEQRRVELSMTCRQLIPAAEHEADVAELVKSLVQFLEVLPDTLERDSALSPEQVDSLHTLIDKQREHFYQRLVTENAPVAEDAGTA